MQDYSGSAGQSAERRWLRTPQAAGITGLAIPTLNKLRVIGGGPPFIKLGRAVLYEQAELCAWMDEHRRRHSTTA